MRTEQLPPGRRRLCMAVDIEKFGARNTIDHIALMRQLAAIVRGAVARSGVPWADTDVQDQGDGLLLILPPGIDEGQALAALVNSLRDLTDETNLVVVSSRQVRLRGAFTQGIVHKGDTGFAGPAVIAVCRLLDSDVVRSALEAHRGSDVAVIIADDLFRDVVAQGYPGLDPAQFVRVEVDLPAKKFTATAWTYAPPPPAAFPASPGPAARSGPASSGRIGAALAGSAGRFVRDVAVGVTGTAITGGIKHLLDGRPAADHHAAPIDRAGGYDSPHASGHDAGHDFGYDSVHHSAADGDPSDGHGHPHVGHHG